MGLKRLLSPQAHRIVGYAFTEMLNNAIDHSIFTSKIADQFVLQSSGFSLLVDNVISDVAVKDI